MPEAHNSPALDTQPEKCAACHPRIYRQWRTSLHAEAVSAGLLGQLPAFDDDTVKDCLNCHAPRAEQQQALKNNNVHVDGYDLIKLVPPNLKWKPRCVTWVLTKVMPL